MRCMWPHTGVDVTHMGPRNWQSRQHLVRFVDLFDGQTQSFVATYCDRRLCMSTVAGAVSGAHGTIVLGRRVVRSFARCTGHGSSVDHRGSDCTHSAISGTSSGSRVCALFKMAF
jgi:hypothetical protein